MWVGLDVGKTHHHATVLDDTGTVLPWDGESVGVEVFTLEQLEKEIKNSPEKFTQDLQFMLAKYRKYFVPLTKIASTY